MIAADLVAKLETRDITLRLFGSCAVWLLCEAARPMLREADRLPKDIDGVLPSAYVTESIRVLSNEGWHHDEAIRAWSESTRLRFSHPAKSLVLDVCVDKLRFAQTLDVRRRLHFHPLCLTQTDVFLSKLQIVKKTRNDLLDLSALIQSFNLGYDERLDLCVPRMKEIARASWRWSKALTYGLDALRDWSSSISDATGPDVKGKLDQLATELRSNHRTVGWYCEALVGRIGGSWFDDVEEP